MSALVVAQPSAQHRQALERLFRRISEISSLPSAAQRLVQLASDDSASAADLRQAIQSDVSLTTRVLRRVNSAYYGLRNPCGDLSVAINLLGFREVRNLALTVFVSRMFQVKGNHGPYTREGLWNHCVAVGAAARMISVVSSRGVPGEAFVAGQMHDIGYILLDQNLRKFFVKVLDGLSECTPTSVVEQRTYSFDHAELGSFACQKWNFPEPIVDAVRWHHEPQHYTGPHRDLVYVVAIANHLCSRAGHTALGIDNTPNVAAHVYTGLGLDRQAIGAISQELGPTLEKAGLLSVI